MLPAKIRADEGGLDRRRQAVGDGSLTGRGCCSPPTSGSMTTRGATGGAGGCGVGDAGNGVCGAGFAGGDGVGIDGAGIVGMDAGEDVAGNGGGITVRAPVEMGLVPTAWAPPVQAGKVRSAAVQEAMPVAQLVLGPAQTGG